METTILRCYVSFTECTHQFKKYISTHPTLYIYPRKIPINRPMGPFSSIQRQFLNANGNTQLPSLKLTFSPLDLVGWATPFLLGRRKAYFQRRAVRFREHIAQHPSRKKKKLTMEGSKDGGVARR